MSDAANKRKNKKKVTKHKSNSGQFLNSKKLTVTINNSVWAVVRFFCLILIWAIVSILILLALADR